jgi:hypothetical protein
LTIFEGLKKFIKKRTLFHSMNSRSVPEESQPDQMVRLAQLGRKDVLSMNEVITQFAFARNHNPSKRMVCEVGGQTKAAPVEKNRQNVRL